MVVPIVVLNNLKICLFMLEIVELKTIVSVQLMLMHLLILGNLFHVLHIIFVFIYAPEPCQNFDPNPMYGGNQIIPYQILQF